MSLCVFCILCWWWWHCSLQVQVESPSRRADTAFRVLSIPPRLSNDPSTKYSVRRPWLTRWDPRRHGLSTNWFQQRCDYAVKRRRKVARDQSEHKPLPTAQTGTNLLFFFLFSVLAWPARGGAGDRNGLGIRGGRPTPYGSSSPADAAGADSSSACRSAAVVVWWWHSRRVTPTLPATSGSSLRSGACRRPSLRGASCATFLAGCSARCL
jgi:hypothetical protein